MMENRTRRITLRFKPDEYEIIEKRFRKTRFRKMSEYNRNVLLQKPVTITYRDRSMDEVLEELILLRKELNYIGNNFNQAVYKLNSVMGMPDAELWQEMLVVLRDQLEPSMKQIKDKLNNYSELWSQKLSAEKI
ncbi:plasmid mobilization protein [Albibacterium sp.]|uniref:plasmid mobilization protein n=1 Tax=Albibacterium sp. TaxID=2952885 RepID=UPI002BF5360A|nr:plasmid mobilization relaxosome protein MobC [Albibacterium sp.]HUH19355.1 hypothetical protein [Albibacterium sp.]